MDYNVQCMGCIKERGKLNLYSPVLKSRKATERKAINSWNRGEIDTNKRFGGYYSNYMGD